MFDFLRLRRRSPRPTRLELDLERRLAERRQARLAPPDPEAADAARRLAKRRRELELQPVKAVARQICRHVGKPVPPALQAKQ